jgi:hypothetical protein
MVTISTKVTGNGTMKIMKKKLNHMAWLDFQLCDNKKQPNRMTINADTSN